MVSIRAIYENGKITLLEEIPQIRHARAIVTIIGDWSAIEPIPTSKPSAPPWLGALQYTLTGKIGDIVSPLEETWHDWEALQT